MGGGGGGLDWKEREELNWTEKEELDWKERDELHC